VLNFGMIEQNFMGAIPITTDLCNFYFFCDTATQLTSRLPHCWGF